MEQWLRLWTPDSEGLWAERGVTAEVSPNVVFAVPWEGFQATFRDGGA